jgi:DNA-binding NarL/FixJ family response regulator
MACVDRARVLIADEYEPVRNRVAKVLSGEFMIVGAVADGERLVEPEALLCPDLVVVDIGMPVMSGIEAAAHIRERGWRVPIVCLTASVEPEVRQAAFDAGVDAYVVKGSLGEDLVPAVKAALAGRTTTD